MPAPTQSIFTSDALKAVRRLRRAMMSSLSAETLGSALDGFTRGELRNAVQLWETIAERDDIIANVKSKREKSIARRDWQIVTDADAAANDSRSRRLQQPGQKLRAAKPATPEQLAQAEAQKAVLKDFWGNVKAVNAFDRNERGGFAKLLKQMMSAVSFRYAAHHIVWRVTPGDKLRATFEFVPLTFFENTSGELRFCPSGYELTGQELAPDEWMVTTGDGLMIAASIGYLAKRNAFADWMIFSERVGVPGVLGRTPHGADTAEGQAMAQAVEDFGADFKAVIYGDVDGSSKLETITFGAGASTLPMPALIEGVNRRLAGLWRGADLSTVSSTSGQGTGATLQGEETDILECDDASNLMETLDEISLRVLKWHFGEDVEPYAYLKIIVPTIEDQKALQGSIEMLVKHGAPVAVNDALERFGFAPPPPEAELLKAPLDYQSSYSEAFKQGATDGSGFDLMNQRQQDGAVIATNAQADEVEFMQRAAELFAVAAAEDRKPIAEALKNVLSQPDQNLLGALTVFNASLPDYITQDAAQAKAWESLIASALLRGWQRGAANPGT